MEKARSEPDSGGWKKKACLPAPPTPSWAASLLPPSRRPGHSCQLPSATSPLTHRRTSSASIPTSWLHAAATSVPRGRLPVCACESSVGLSEVPSAGPAGEPHPPLGAPRLSQPVPGNCPVSLEPPVLSGCPTRPRQHPEVTPPPHVPLCISPAWPRAHSLWASLATGHLIHLLLG